VERTEIRKRGKRNLHEVADAADIDDYLVRPALDQFSAKLPNHGAIIE
jgi:hypothetical protein